MQINGVNADQFDLITATGNVNLGGATLDLLANPPCTACAGSEAYFPTDGDTFTIISINPAPAPGDYDGNGTVGPEDYDAWRAAFGTTGGFPAADGNNDGVVDAADYVIWRKNLGQSSSVTGSIAGTLNINVVDPYGSWTGFSVVPVYTATTLQLKFVATGSGTSVSAVPEPSALPSRFHHARMAALHATKKQRRMALWAFIAVNRTTTERAEDEESKKCKVWVAKYRWPRCSTSAACREQMFGQNLMERFDDS